MLVSVGGEKPDNEEKNSPEQVENHQQTQSTYGTGPESNLGELVRGERSQYCIVPAPRLLNEVFEILPSESRKVYS